MLSGQYLLQRLHVVQLPMHTYDCAIDLFLKIIWSTPFKLAV
jgi:hypothetical protein